MYGARGYSNGFRGGRGAKPWSGNGPYENRYMPLNTDSEGDTRQNTDGFEIVRGKNKRQRRSTGGTYGQPGSGYAKMSQGVQYKFMTKDEFRSLSLDEKLVTMFEGIVDLGSNRMCT